MFSDVPRSTLVIHSPDAPCTSVVLIVMMPITLPFNSAVEKAGDWITAMPSSDRAPRTAAHTSWRSAYLLLKNGLSARLVGCLITFCTRARAVASLAMLGEVLNWGVDSSTRTAGSVVGDTPWRPCGGVVSTEFSSVMQWLRKLNDGTTDGMLTRCQHDVNICCVDNSRHAKSLNRLA